MDNNDILKALTKIFTKHLGDSLVGVYLHGSMAMGCYTKNSDIDVMVVVRRASERSVYRHIIEDLVEFENISRTTLEISVVLEEHTNNFMYPTPFELHYSREHEERYVSHPDYICGGETDKDLAAHFTIIKHRGACLFGEDIEVVFGDVPKEHYISSIMYDIEDVKTDIQNNPVYYILNLCRILFYLKENVVSSKLEGGNWGIKYVPNKYKHVIDTALRSYTNASDNPCLDNNELILFTDYMKNEIESFKTN